MASHHLTLVPHQRRALLDREGRLPASQRHRANRRRRLVRALSVVMSLGAPGGVTALLAGCGADTMAGLSPVADILVEPATPVVALDQTLRLTATPRDAGGQPLGGRSVVWTSEDPARASVNADGVVTPHAVGRVRIAASAEGHSAIVGLQVTAGSVAQIALSPSPVSLVQGSTMRITAAMLDAAGNDASNRTVVWSTSTASVATVDASGAVTGVAPGTATIMAQAEGRTATVAVSVTPVPVAQVIVSPSDVTIQAGDTRQLTVVTKDASGATLVGRSVVWNSASPSVATVSTTGMVSAVAAGTTTISATVDGVVGTARVTVTPGIVTTPTPTPTPTPDPAARLEVVSGNGQSAKAGAELAQPLVVRAVDARGRAVPGVLVTWTPSDGGRALPTSVTITDAQGLASVRWKLGNAEETQTMRASAIGVATVTFTAEATKR